MKKIKKRDIYITWDYLSGKYSHVGFIISCNTFKGELLFNFIYYFEMFYGSNTMSDNVQIVIDDINRFLLLKNYCLTDKALFYIENELFNVFNGYTSDFSNKLYIIKKSQNSN